MYVNYNRSFIYSCELIYFFVSSQKIVILLYYRYLNVVKLDITADSRQSLLFTEKNMQTVIKIEKSKLLFRMCLK